MLSIDPANQIANIFLMTSLATILYCQLAHATESEDERREQADFPKAIGRLLLKSLRFRDLSDVEPPYDEEMKRHESYKELKHVVPYDEEFTRQESYKGLKYFGPYGVYGTATDTNTEHNNAQKRTQENIDYAKLSKRERQRALVQNLAKLLSKVKGRDGGLRMPSLRFG